MMSAKVQRQMQRARGNRDVRKTALVGPPTDMQCGIAEMRVENAVGGTRTCSRSAGIDDLYSGDICARHAGMVE